MPALNRVIVLTSPGGVAALYVPIDRSMKRITIQADVTGTATFAVDYTLDNIIRNAASPYDHSEGLVAPASANWTNLVASGSADVVHNGDLSAYALRLNQTAGAGTVKFSISQAH